VLAEVESDKATMELECFHSGVLSKIVHGDESEVAVGEVIATLTRKRRPPSRNLLRSRRRRLPNRPHKTRAEAETAGGSESARAAAGSDGGCGCVIPAQAGIHSRRRKPGFPPSHRARNTAHSRE